MTARADRIAAIDLFCGVGGLSYGLQEAGISVVGGIDLDPACSFPFSTNIEAPFLERDAYEITADHLNRLWRGARIRMLAGCAPCTPFSPYRRGVDTTGDKKWPLLGEFARLVRTTTPDLVTMENVPRIRTAQVFQDFVAHLEALGYYVHWRSCDGTRFGLAQTRRRLVLVASLLGEVKMPDSDGTEERRTVADVIRGLPGLRAGEADPLDPLHRTRSLSAINLERMRASTPGGTWEDWPSHLRAPCHRKTSGASFRNVYARMEWDKPAPTITTLAHNFGTGRFGHPKEDRVISLREAAMLQGFPREYKFVRADATVHFNHSGRLIGNAVPPPLGRAIGKMFVEHVARHANN